MGGNYYVFGSRVILLRVNQKGQFSVSIPKSNEESTLPAFLKANLATEYDTIIELLKGPKRGLMDRADPVSAVADDIESLFRREYSFGFKPKK